MFSTIIFKQKIMEAVPGTVLFSACKEKYTLYFSVPGTLKNFL